MYSSVLELKTNSSIMCLQLSLSRSRRYSKSVKLTARYPSSESMYSREMTSYHFLESSNVGDIAILILGSQLVMMLDISLQVLCKPLGF